MLLSLGVCDVFLTEYVDEELENRVLVPKCFITTFFIITSKLN